MQISLVPCVGYQVSCFKYVLAKKDSLLLTAEGLSAAELLREFLVMKAGSFKRINFVLLCGSARHSAYVFQWNTGGAPRAAVTFSKPKESF